MKTEFFLTLPLKNSEMICLNLGVSLHVPVLKKNPYSINTFFLIESTHYEKSKSTKKHTTNDD